jgi:hypothetical protein
LLGDKTQDLDMRNRYAARLTFFEFVRRDYAARLVRLAKVIRATVAGTAYAGIIRAAAVQELGGLGEEFREHVLAQRPQWDERSRRPTQLGFAPSPSGATGLKPRGRCGSTLARRSR